MKLLETHKVPGIDVTVSLWMGDFGYYSTCISLANVFSPDDSFLLDDGEYEIGLSVFKDVIKWTQAPETLALLQDMKRGDSIMRIVEAYTRDSENVLAMLEISNARTAEELKSLPTFGMF
jgi:hypothetical protein